MIDKLLKAAKRFQEQTLKLAAYPAKEVIAPLIKETVENLVDIHPDVMEGVLYVSNIQPQATLEDMYVSFLVNINNAPELQDRINANKPARDQLIRNAVLGMLELKFKEFQFRINFGDFPTEDPGWFGKKYD